jgi:hypothetical protein
MPDLNFQVENASAVPLAAAPLMGFHLRATNTAGDRVHAVGLRCQIQIEATRRRYTPEEQASLQDLFGEPHRWGQTLRTMLWTHANVVVPEFHDAALVDLQVPCTFDFNVAVVKYFHGLQDGEIPLCFQFSGSIFYEDVEGRLQVAPISWDKEARFRLPLRTWKQMMDVHYPNSAWLYLRRDVFDRLYQHKVNRGIPTWEQTIEELLQHAERGASA